MRVSRFAVTWQLQFDSKLPAILVHIQSGITVEQVRQSHSDVLYAEADAIFCPGFRFKWILNDDSDCISLVSCFDANGSTFQQDPRTLD